MALVANIKSDSSDEIYEVVIYPSGKATCTCPGAHYRQYCKHINRVQDLIAPSQKKKEHSPCQTCGKSTGSTKYPYCNQCEWEMFGGEGKRPVAHIQDIPAVSYTLTDKFYGKTGSDDPSRERYVQQQSVKNGLLPNGQKATQEGVDGYVADEYVRQVQVDKGCLLYTSPSPRDS